MTPTIGTSRGLRVAESIGGLSDRLPGFEGTLLQTENGPSGALSPEIGVLVFSGIFVLAGLYLLYSHAGERISRARLYLGMEAFDPNGGNGDEVVAVQGTIGERDETVLGPLSGEECVAYTATEQELRWRQTEGDTNPNGTVRVGDDDDSGHSLRWTTVSADTESVPFHVETSNGSVAVDPHAAELNLPVRASETSSFLKRWLLQIPVLNLLMRFFGRPERRVERHVKPGDRVTVIGDVEPSESVDDGAVAAVDRPGSSGVFTITTRSSRSLALRSAVGAFTSTLPGMVFLGVGLVVLIGSALSGVFA